MDKKDQAPKVKKEIEDVAEKTVDVSSVSDNSFSFKDISLNEVKSDQLSFFEKISSEYLTVGELNKYNPSFCKYYLYSVYLIVFFCH